VADKFYSFFGVTGFFDAVVDGSTFAAGLSSITLVFGGITIVFDF
jgi:hypothetical protein